MHEAKEKVFGLKEEMKMSKYQLWIPARRKRGGGRKGGRKGERKRREGGRKEEVGTQIICNAVKLNPFVTGFTERQVLVTTTVTHLAKSIFKTVSYLLMNSKNLGSSPGLGERGEGEGRREREREHRKTLYIVTYM